MKEANKKPCPEPPKDEENLKVMEVDLVTQEADRIK
jgi:hypothetical protein